MADLSSDDDDDDYVPEAALKKRRLTKKRRKRKQRLPDFSALSIPRPVQRLHPDFALSQEFLRGACVEEYELSSLGRGPKPEGAAEDAAVHLIAGVEDGGPANDDPLVARWRKIYKRELPGCPYYDDAYHMLYTMDANGAIVSGGASFRVLLLTTNEGVALLIIDVLAVAVNRETKGKGCGTQILGALKLVALDEASNHCVQPLLLTQADNACISFWEKRGGFTRARDAADLTRSLRREHGCDIFSGATPMALMLSVKPGGALNRPKGHGTAAKLQSGIAKRRSSSSAGQPVLSLSQKQNMMLHVQR